MSDINNSTQMREQRKCTECGWQDANYPLGGGDPPACDCCGCEFAYSSEVRYVSTDGGQETDTDKITINRDRDEIVVGDVGIALFIEGAGSLKIDHTSQMDGYVAFISEDGEEMATIHLMDRSGYNSEEST